MAVNPFMDPLGLWSELLYTLFVVVLCFLIYWKTKESYDLTKHRGIKFFREAFMFLGLSYLVRFLFGITRYGDRIIQLFDLRLLFPFFLVLTSYLSTIGIIYLVFSSIWNRVKGDWLVVLSHAIAVMLSVVTLLTRSPEILFFLQLGLLVVATVIGFIARKQHRISKTRVIYVALLVFWLISIWTLEPMRFFPHELRIVFQVISLIVFAFIYYRVVKWAK